MAWFNINNSIFPNPVWITLRSDLKKVPLHYLAVYYVLITWIFTEVSFRFLYIKKSLGIHNQKQQFFRADFRLYVDSPWSTSSALSTTMMSSSRSSWFCVWTKFAVYWKDHHLTRVRNTMFLLYTRYYYSIVLM